MRLARFIIPIFFIQPAMALDCKPPAQLKQAEGQDQRLLSWCEVDGVKNGPFEQFSVKGGLEVHATYKDGKLDGEFKRFWPNGITATQGVYKAGRMSGSWTRYRENGKIQDEGSWSEDKPNKGWKFFDSGGGLAREVTYDDNGEAIRAEEKEKEKEIAKPLRTSDFWRLRLGLAHSESGDGGNSSQPGGNGSTGGKATGPGFGADLHLFQLGRWLRTELAARVLPEYDRNKQKKVESGQLNLAFDPFASWLDPFAFTFRIGPQFVGFDKPKLGFGFGLRYMWHENRRGFNIPGMFFEVSGYDEHGDNNNCGNCGGPPNNNQNNNGGGGGPFFFGGIIIGLG